MQQTCRDPWCQQSFTVTDSDLRSLEKLSPVIGGVQYTLPPPTLCPDCRQQRRLMYRNERNFYRRPCAKTGREVISIYASDQPCVVYDQTVWWLDDWDQLSTGQVYDGHRSFFEQFQALSLRAPRPCIVNMSSENSLYTNHSAYNKNCYMCINTGYSEDCFYCSDYTIFSKNCIDCLAVHKCELCYECTVCKQCSYSSFLHECINCSDCSFCEDCQSCTSCFGCWNLRHKSHCLFNEQLTKEEYAKRVGALTPKTWAEQRTQLAECSLRIQSQALHRCVVREQCEESNGDHLFQCKNVRDSYYMTASEDCAYCYDGEQMKDSIDIVEPFKGELQYETHGCNLGYAVCVCSKCYECKNVLYSQYCWYCRDCFGCFGIRNKQYCVLNRQYTKEEYEVLVAKIIEQMRTDGEYGEFFPQSSTLFGYNETAAQRYYPLSKEEAIARGWRWREQRDDLPKVTRAIEARDLPERTEDVPDDIVNWAITCSETARPFRLVQAELSQYRSLHLPIPHLHPDERFRRRSALRNPRKLWKRNCTKCGKEIETTYEPSRPEIVYCESCYLQSVY